MSTKPHEAKAQLIDKVVGHADVAVSWARDVESEAN
jgi:hypothetical protein